VQIPDLVVPHQRSLSVFNSVLSVSELQGPAPSPAAYDDGLVEVYGLTAGALKSGWNVRTVEAHTKCLGQGKGLRLYIQSSDSTEHSVYTLMDGEDWWQSVPASKSGTSVRDGMLVRLPCTRTHKNTCVQFQAYYTAFTLESSFFTIVFATYRSVVSCATVVRCGLL
jgi:hypothetical protein